MFPGPELKHVDASWKKNEELQWYFCFLYQGSAVYQCCGVLHGATQGFTQLLQHAITKLRIERNLHLQVFLLLSVNTSSMRTLKEIINIFQAWVF